MAKGRLEEVMRVKSWQKGLVIVVAMALVLAAVAFASQNSSTVVTEAISIGDAVEVVVTRA